MITITNLTKRFNDKVIFNNLNLHLHQNKKYAIIGKTGCGKSTLFNILSGIDTDFNGTIEINNHINPNLFKNKLFRDDICLILQNDLLDLNKTVFKNLEVLGNREEILKVLNKVKMNDFIDEPVINLSGGQRSRINLSRAFLKKSKVYLIDEPTSNLDNDNKNLISSLIAEIDGTVLIITHDLQYLHLYDYVVNLDKL